MIDRLRELKDLEAKATPAPWKPQTEGNYDQRHAAAAAFQAVMARRDPDSPEIQFSDLSYVLTENGEASVALVGNGRRSVENAALIAESRNQLGKLLAIAEAAFIQDSERWHCLICDGWDGNHNATRNDAGPCPVAALDNR
jgi:hypothetical protein